MDQLGLGLNQINDIGAYHIADALRNNTVVFNLFSMLPYSVIQLFFV